MGGACQDKIIDPLNLGALQCAPYIFCEQKKS